MLYNNPFIGIEAEGPDRGERTLFIPNYHYIKPARIINILLRHHDIKRLYFGAGDKRGICPEHIPLIETLAKEFRYKFIAEVNNYFHFTRVPPPLRPLIEWVYCFHIHPATGEQVSLPDLRLIKFLDYIISAVKIVTKDKVYWIHIEKRVFVNKLNDPLYEEDKECLENSGTSR